MKEALARAVGNPVGLGEAASHDSSPVDRLHALAWALRDGGELMELGAALILLDLANVRSVREAHRAADLLALMLVSRKHLRVRPKQARRLAIQALREAIAAACPSCHGTGETPAESAQAVEGAVPMRVCQRCRGVGVRRWTDAERRDAGIGRQQERVFDEAGSILSSAVPGLMYRYRRVFLA